MVVAGKLERFGRTAGDLSKESEERATFFKKCFKSQDPR
jgi:hypothetical protein